MKTFTKADKVQAGLLLVIILLIAAIVFDAKLQRRAVSPTSERLIKMIEETHEATVKQSRSPCPQLEEIRIQLEELKTLISALPQSQKPVVQRKGKAANPRSEFATDAGTKEKQ